MGSGSRLGWRLLVYIASAERNQGAKSGCRPDVGGLCSDRLGANRSHEGGGTGVSFHMTERAIPTRGESVSEITIPQYSFGGIRARHFAGAAPRGSNPIRSG
jgi:hypothetical protein